MSAAWRTPLWLAGTLVLTACRIDAGGVPVGYSPCQLDGRCQPGCSCFGDGVCVPDQEDLPPETCAWCLPGSEDCDGDATNGCEALTDSDMNHCGGCFQACDRLLGDVCQGATRIHFQAGSCQRGRCMYPRQEKQCPCSCHAGACLPDSCL